MERFQQFTVLITKINRSIHKIKTGEMEEFSLKSPHVSCLYYLYTMGELTAKELCDVCAEDKGATSRSLEYLESEGYIICESGQKKRYRAPLKLTEKGAAIGRSIADKIERILQNASEGMQEEERVIFYKNLALISNNLESICKKYEG